MTSPTSELEAPSLVCGQKNSRDQICEQSKPDQAVIRSDILKMFPLQILNRSMDFHEKYLASLFGKNTPFMLLLFIGKLLLVIMQPFIYFIIYNIFEP